MKSANYPGALIARERLARNWSQEGLCRGICSVSYLSKIETGRAEASGEVLALLMARLGIEYSMELEQEAEALAEEGFDALFSGCYDELARLLSGKCTEKYRAAAHGLELALLGRFVGDREPLPEELEKYMDPRSLGLQRMLQSRAEEAILLLPNAFAYFEAGAAAYSRGEYVRAMEYLQTGYDAAAADGSAKLMLVCKLFLGGCCANRRDMEGTARHYRAARRLAKALGDSEALEQMDYNTAATAIECGNYEQAYAYFSNVDEPGMMSLHKKAICCEMTGRRDEALAALDMAEGMECDYPPTGLARELCALVRYRLEHPGYLESVGYGEMLLAAFERCRRELSAGYAYFHLPWVLEWYKANRQYKKAMELMEEFPEK